MVIGVEQAVGQRLTDRLMHGGVIDAENAVELERGLQGFGKLAVHAEKEIKEVA